jgi:hypothetical protein
MHAPESRSESAAARLARAAQEHGLAAARWAGRGHALALAARRLHALWRPVT